MQTKAGQTPRTAALDLVSRRDASPHDAAVEDLARRIAAEAGGIDLDAVMASPQDVSKAWEAFRGDTPTGNPGLPAPAPPTSPSGGHRPPPEAPDAITQADREGAGLLPLEAGPPDSPRSPRSRAAARIQAMGLPPELEARAGEVLGDPALLTQADVGICGMLAVVQVLARQRPGLFADLVEAVFQGGTFNGVPIPLKEGTNTTVLLHQRQKQEARKKAQGRRVESFDFYIARSLGKLLKIKNPALYQEQRGFLRTGGFREDYTVKTGDLALYTEGVSAICDDVLGASGVRSERFTPERAAALMKEASAHLEAGGFVIAARPDDEDDAASAGYDHWFVLNSATPHPTRLGHYTIEVFNFSGTGTNFNVTVAPEDCPDIFHTLVSGTL